MCINYCFSLSGEQGDQMSFFEKVAQSVAQTFFRQN
jgi:hypothetical protein